MNDRIQDLINGMAGHAGAADWLMKVAARDFIYLAVVLLIGLWFWPGDPARRALNQRVAVVAVLAVALALGVGDIVHHLVSEARPFVSDPSTRQLIPHAPDSGLPSDHALAGFALGGAVIWWRRLTGIITLAVGALIGFARVYVGVHWPLDIVVGAVIGLLAGGAAAWTAPWWIGPQRLLSRYIPPLMLACPGDSR